MTTPHNSVPYSWNLPLNIDGKILGAAYDVIMEKGIDNTTISEIASRAGISRPTLYRRFNDINAVFYSLVTSIMLDVMNQCYRLVDTVEELIDTLLDFVIRVREQPIFDQLARSERGFLANYFVMRLGISQRESLAVLASLIHHCRAVDPSQLRDEDDMELAAMVIMMLQGTSLSVGSMSRIISNATWRRQLKYALTGLLSPSADIPPTEIPPSPETSAINQRSHFISPGLPEAEPMSPPARFMTDISKPKNTGRRTSTRTSTRGTAGKSSEQQSRADDTSTPANTQKSAKNSTRRSSRSAR